MATRFAHPLPPLQGKADRNCRRTKTMMFNNPAVLHALLDHLTEALIAYVGYQIEAGAQVGRDVLGGWGTEVCEQAGWWSGCCTGGVAGRKHASAVQAA